MPDAQFLATPYLHGNCDPCPACELQRTGLDTGPSRRAKVPCNLCGGKGYLPLEDGEIVRRTVIWAREHYWPERITQ